MEIRRQCRELVTLFCIVILLPGLVHGNGSARSEWRTGRATFYGEHGNGKHDGFSIHQGSCMFGKLNKNSGTGLDVAAISDNHPEFQNSCGKCYELACEPMVFHDNTGEQLERMTACREPNRTVIVTITDSCPCYHTQNLYSNKRWCCGDMDHFDLSVYAFKKLAPLSKGVIGLKYRPVPCPADQPGHPLSSHPAFAPLKAISVKNTDSEESALDLDLDLDIDDDDDDDGSVADLDAENGASQSGGSDWDAENGGGTDWGFSPSAVAPTRARVIPGLSPRQPKGKDKEAGEKLNRKSPKSESSQDSDSDESEEDRPSHIAPPRARVIPGLVPSTKLRGSDKEAGRKLPSNNNTLTPQSVRQAIKRTSNAGPQQEKPKQQSKEGKSDKGSVKKGSGKYPYSLSWYSPYVDHTKCMANVKQHVVYSGAFGDCFMDGGLLEFKPFNKAGFKRRPAWCTELDGSRSVSVVGKVRGLFGKMSALSFYMKTNRGVPDVSVWLVGTKGTCGPINVKEMKASGKKGGYSQYIVPLQNFNTDPFAGFRYGNRKQSMTFSGCNNNDANDVYAISFMNNIRVKQGLCLESMKLEGS